METRVTLSSKGQLVIPKALRAKIGLHSGSELRIELRHDDSLEIYKVQKNITCFFGLGKVGDTKIMSIDDMDTAISKAVTDNDRS